MRQLTFVDTGRLQWQDVPEPELQGPDEALVRPLVVARCDVDLPIVSGLTPFRPPLALGHEFVAEIVALGDAVSAFRIGQKVVVSFQITCGECDVCRRGLTGSCSAVVTGAAYGFGARGGEWGGALSDLVRVPFANSMLIALPDGVDPVTVASPDNLSDGWRTVGPFLGESPAAPVLVMAGAAFSVGLYAAAIAVAMGSPQVDYVDTDKIRLELAKSVGANPIEGPPPERLGPYPVTVDASANVAGLACAIRSTAPGGTCTSVGIYFAPETPVPLLDMYRTGITFMTGRVNAHAVFPHVLDLVKGGRLHPEQLTTRLARWEDAAEAFLEPSVKVVVTRG